MINLAWWVGVQIAPQSTTRAPCPLAGRGERDCCDLRDERGGPGGQRRGRGAVAGSRAGCLKRADGAYDSAAEGSFSAAIGEEPDTGQFPGTVFCVIREDPPRDVPGRSARHVHNKVVVLGHCLFIVLSFTGLSKSARGQVQVKGRKPAHGDRHGNSRDRLGGWRDSGRDRRRAVAPRMVLAAGFSSGRPANSREDSGKPPQDSGKPRQDKGKPPRRRIPGGTASARM